MADRLTLTGDGEVYYEVQVRKVSKRIEKTKTWVQNGDGEKWGYVVTDAIAESSKEVFSQCVETINLGGLARLLNPEA